MLAKAEQRLAAEPDEVRRRVRLVQGTGEQAQEATGGERFAGGLCHGVLMYLRQPEPLMRALCHSAADGGVVSVMALNTQTLWLCQGQLAPECQRYSAPPVTAGLASGWQSRGSR